MAAASLAAAAAIIVTHLDKICDFIESCKRTADDACRRASRCDECCADECCTTAEEDSDFEDVDL